ncbi:DUF1761 domain-containing protein [Aliidiomarina halalkaliphila]|uniref:DUF1761 domain-containing protein n=1 Tax=Aliidiomarina halalkaliphila TaxID=2593535 RepID=A0A552X374_9GAMM|nr:DUF1761 domain-containing protein [Aliidiomarina halalkaliphila]TRW49435.1 DUF1761 domain-containing protein [Aliidiomarina halalkaliphila]
MEFPTWWAVLLAAASNFMLGGLWFSVLFGKLWMRELGFSEEQLEKGNMTKIFGLAFVFNLAIASFLGMFLNQPTIGAAQGAFYGFLSGFGWIFFAIAVNSLYEQRGWKYVLITGGFWTVSLTLMGLILGAWG